MSDTSVMPKVRAKILAVDDEPRGLRSLAALLEASGYDVQTASGGLEAQKWLEKQLFDVALLDLMMPDMNGYGVMNHLRELGIDTTVIVVSGDVSINSAIDALRAGAHDFLRKPYAPEVLLKAVENAVRNRRLEQEQRLMQARLEHSEQLYRYMVDNSPDIIYMLDEEGCFRFINSRAESLLGYGRSELVGRHFSTILYQDDQNAARYVFAERRAGDRRAKDIELRLLRKEEGTDPLYVQNSFIPIELNAWGVYEGGRGDGQRFIGTYGVARDISARKRDEETIQFQAHHDLLTSLPNRVLFNEHVRRALIRVDREGGCMAVIYLDLDRFKVINDELGYVIGDELLCALAERLQESLRDDDTLARLGGDEFAILLSGVGEAADAGAVAEKLLATMSEPIVAGGHKLFLRASLGIAVYPGDGESAGVLLKNAELAMYHGRCSAKGHYQYYGRQMDGTFSRHLILERGIHSALGNGEFSLCFQPQVSAGSHMLVGVEALLRWDHPEMGAVSPAEFVPVAEETGLIVALGDWVLQKSCEELARWRQAGHTGVRLAVNVSAIQLSQARFAEKVADVLARYAIPGSALEVEITENVLMSDMDTMARKLRTLNDYGITVAIDDFGTGYSSLSYLQQLPIHRIKIDRSFVNAIGGNVSESSIIVAIVAMANGLGLGVIAEGVETEQQSRYLARIGCSELQGFLLSHPVSSDAILELLDARTPMFGMPTGHSRQTGSSA